MKRILSLLAVFAIVFSLTVPALAVDYNGKSITPPSSVDYSVFPYYVMFDEVGTGKIFLLFSREPFVYGSDSTGQYVGFIPSNDKYGTRVWVAGETTWRNSSDLDIRTGFAGVGGYMLYSSHDIYYADSEIKAYSSGNFPILISECDGTSCPATDLDHDNICDDCGKVLTMSLRSSLWEYAQSVVANGMSIFDSDYWLITDNGENGYKIYISSVPFKYISSSDSVVSTGVVQRTEVYDTSDGSYSGGTSWASKQPNTALDVGTPVATSHPIEGFFPIPLWMEMDRLTQGEMAEMGQTMGGTMRILVPCGVGCLVLLVVLKLFGKRLLIFRN